MKSNEDVVDLGVIFREPSVCACDTDVFLNRSRGSGTFMNSTPTSTHAFHTLIYECTCTLRQKMMSDLV